MKKTMMRRQRASKFSTYVKKIIVLDICRFVVEAIKSHLVNDVGRGLIIYPFSYAVADSKIKGQIMYHVKWEGYEKRSDMTWEPEENLLYVHQLCHAAYTFAECSFVVDRPRKY